MSVTAFFGATEQAAPVLSAVREQEHDPVFVWDAPAFRVCCRSCGGIVTGTITLNEDNDPTTEVMYDALTAEPCNRKEW